MVPMKIMKIPISFLEDYQKKSFNGYFYHYFSSIFLPTYVFGWILLYRRKHQNLEDHCTQYVVSNPGW